MKVLVTGGHGFVGSHLVEALLEKGYAVRCLVRKSSNLRWIQGKSVELVYGDLLQPSSLDAATKGVDFIYHLAGVIQGRKRETFFEGNHKGTIHLLQSVTRTEPPLKKFLYVSSLTAVGPAPTFAPLTEDSPCQPISYYGESKFSAEKACLARSSAIPITIVRPPAVYGPREEEIYTFFSMAKRGIIPLFPPREKYLSLIYVTDLVRGMILAAEKREAVGKIYFIAPYEIVSSTNIMNSICRSLHVCPKQVILPLVTLKLAAKMADYAGALVKRDFSLSSQRVKDLIQKYWICSPERAERDLNFVAKTQLTEGVDLTTEWYKKNGWL